MIMDMLYEKVKENGHVCVGLDTAPEYLPEEFMKKFSNEADAVFEFNRRIIDATIDKSACYKVQVAYYEAMGINGMKCYSDTLKYIRSHGAIAISDIKRGDIANTAKMYAKAHFEGDFETDIVTLSPYMGMDSLEPYLPYVKNKNKGMFVLVRTSNKGCEDLQYIEDREGKKLYRHTADMLMDIGKDYMGTSPYNSIGGVVGCTHIDEARQLREDLKGMFFLIPGYGAQGGGGKEAAAYMKDGNGGVVNSSRGILLAYKNYEDGKLHFDECARKEVIRMKEDIASGIRLQDELCAK